MVCANRLLLWVFLICASAGEGSQDPKTVQEAIAARLARLQDLHTEYEIHTEYLRDPESRGPLVVERAESAIVVKTGSEKWRKSFSFLEGRARYDCHRVEAKPDMVTRRFVDGLATKQVDSWSKDRVESLRGWEGPTPSFEGQILNRCLLPRSEVEAPLGLRTLEGQDWVTPESVAQMALSLPNADTAVLRAKDAEGSVHEWTFDRRLGYAPTRYRVLVETTQRLYFQADMTKFENVQGVLLPMAIETKEIFVNPKGGYRVGRRDHIKVERYKVDDPTNTPERYRISWPEGAFVLDLRSGLHFRIRGGKKTLDDDRIYDRTIEMIEKFPGVGLQGKNGDADRVHKQSDASIATDEGKQHPHTMRSWWPLPAILGGVAMVLGLGLLFGRRGLARMVQRIRTAGHKKAVAAGEDESTRSE